MRACSGSAISRWNNAMPSASEISGTPSPSSAIARCSRAQNRGSGLGLAHQLEHAADDGAGCLGVEADRADPADLAPVEPGDLQVFQARGEQRAADAAPLVIG